MIGAGRGNVPVLEDHGFSRPVAGLVGDLDVWLPAGLILVRAHLRNINGARSLACDPILTRLWRRESHVVAHPPCLIAEVGDVLSGGGHVREVRVLGQHAALERRGQEEGELVVHRVGGMICTRVLSS